MALAQRRNGIQASIWPGFVDAMTALLLVLMFVLTIFMVVQAVLRETITGQENELNELGAEVGALSAALGLATSQRDDLRVELGSLRATLSQAEDDIDARDARIRDFEAQVAALLVQQSQTQAQITALQGENAQILSDKEALDLALAAARDEISAGEQAARLAAARREALEALIADLRAENTETTALLGQTEQALTDEQQELSDAEIARIADAQAAAALRARLEAAQDELTATTLALEAKRQEAEDTLTVLAATQETRDDLNARGALWHVIQTFVGSLLIIATALVIQFTGFLQIDPILGAAFGVVLFWASIGVIREAVHILMEGTPEDTDLDAVIDDLRGQDGVLDVHHVHAWTLTSGKHAVSAHLRHADPTDAARILENAYSRLTHDHSFHMVTLQLETDCLDERHAQDLDVTGNPSTDALDMDKHKAKTDNKPKRSHH